jgi:hypothetical protein
MAGRGLRSLDAPLAKLDDLRSVLELDGASEGKGLLEELRSS